ncbi:DUF3014 domain-containing protein [Paraglaciecola aquimarina]|uniref:DUF3014 domain-containing protein n=1 Tax=Paraglaciecola aquimarina TaxID=1235557 RepID=A0ABU3STI3_9ALTE|nr:DUF3014 domain-containing protein [Paraglaciecola aquimarina]MDU0353316.1 DUF3014 domain-containing protein [Paraglaciecola aquimarina]
MSEESNKSLVPHFAIGAIVIAIILAVFFWPNEPEVEPVPDVIAPTVEPITAEPVVEPEVLEPVEPEPIPEPVEAPVVIEPIPEPEPLDTSDGAVKTKLLTLTDYDAFARLIIDESLLQRFVVMTNTLADENISPSHNVLTNPEQSFRVYRQANKDWIDPASYKRYTPYVDVLDSIETDSLIELYEEYKPAIKEIFAEISSPNDDFEEKLVEAIDILLDTPEVPVPVEVFTDSVMFKFADERLESLSGPQKQLLRTGPENMRRIKAKLREIKESFKQ